MLLLEANDTFSFLEGNIVPVADSTVCLDLAHHEVILIAEAYLVDPVLAGLDPDFADGTPSCEQVHRRLALVDA